MPEAVASWTDSCECDRKLSRRPRLAKGSGDLLLDSDHPQVPLGLVIGKGKREINEISQHLLGSPQLLIEQILGGTLLAPPAALGKVFG